MVDVIQDHKRLVRRYLIAHYVQGFSPCCNNSHESLFALVWRQGLNILQECGLIYVQYSSLLCTRGLTTAICFHIDQTISRSQGEPYHFGSLDPTPLRDSRCTLVEIRSWFILQILLKCLSKPYLYGYHQPYF